MPQICVLIVAAGRGRRAGGDLPKQYVSLAGRPVLSHTVERFASLAAVGSIAVVIHPDDIALYDAAVAAFTGRLLPPVMGGETRQQSVLNGLVALAAGDCAHVLIHDAARPFVHADVIGRVIDGLVVSEAVLPVVPLTDTVKEVTDGRVNATLDRSRLFGAQTPQGFQLATILSLHKKAAKVHDVEFTDDASIAEWAGVPVLAVEGDGDNRKLTTAEDIRMAELVMRSVPFEAREMRTGSGLDVHRFAAGDAVILCGVSIPFDQKLEGHSDADVALHAVTDALLGAIGDGDIGQHFPPSDPQWKGAASAVFLKDAVRRIEAAGGRIVHIDLTLICEAPKIAPHRDAMRTSLADLAGVAIERVSIKATTTEGLGFTGRREGIAAQAVASVELPRAQS